MLAVITFMFIRSVTYNRPNKKPRGSYQLGIDPSSLDMPNLDSLPLRSHDQITCPGPILTHLRSLYLVVLFEYSQIQVGNTRGSGNHVTKGIY
jgi:hypothetical protein